MRESDRRRNPGRVSLGVDYGTESGRVLVLDLSTGMELAIEVVPYQHGVIDQMLPNSSIQLPAEWALQDPQDYLDVLHQGIPSAMAASRIVPDQVVGIGVDFTTCTVLPVDSKGIPLCFDAFWASHPHAWSKLWKHHAAQVIAERMNQIAFDRGETFLSRYGGRISSEWYYPKLIQIFEDDPAVYAAMYRFVEATDWIVWYLTGEERRNSCTAGFKALWTEREGLPPLSYFTAIAPGFDDPQAKLGQNFFPVGQRAGNLREEVANLLGLRSGVAVAVGNADAPVAVPALGVSGPDSLVVVMGTSICHLTVAAEELSIPGITGVVKDGILPGWYGYDAGQSAVGDMFAWFMRTSVPGSYQAQASASGRSVYEYVEARAGDLTPGMSGLLALDWWNGNRSILADDELSGVMVGMTLRTSVEAQYRALLEAAAMGTRRIIENFQQHHIPITKLMVCGGLSRKSSLLMQIFADVTGLPLVVPNSLEISARGAALFGAVAAGAGNGGFASIAEASAVLAAPIKKVYEPNAESVRQYDEIYALYRVLYDQFGNGAWADVLHRLKAIQRARLRQRSLGRREEISKS